MTYVKKTHRFGLLTPSSNTTQEPEFNAALPADVSLHTGRVSYRDIVVGHAGLKGLSQAATPAAPLRSP